MELKDLVFRESRNYTEGELRFIVEQYIQIRKQRRVKIVPSIFPDQDLLTEGGLYAQKWLKENHFKV
jgi:hypothetical protein